jgi:hypothetical protein
MRSAAAKPVSILIDEIEKLSANLNSVAGLDAPTEQERIALSQICQVYPAIESKRRRVRKAKTDGDK